MIHKSIQAHVKRLLANQNGKLGLYNCMHIFVVQAISPQYFLVQRNSSQAVALNKMQVLSWIRTVVKHYVCMCVLICAHVCACFKKGIWVNQKSSYKVQLPWFHLQPVTQRQPESTCSSREERRGDRFKSSGNALDSLCMPLPFGTP